MSNDSRRAMMSGIGVNVLAPLAIFYGARACGADQWLALTLGTIPPLLRTGWTVATRRRVDGLALFALSVIVVSVAVSFLTGSPRFLLAKDGWLTGLAGLWILATLARTPFYFQAARSMTRGETHERIERSWVDSPAFQRKMRIATVIWGVGLIADSGVRILLAYTLPIDHVPLISGLQYVALILVLEASSLAVVRSGQRVQG
ncbi:hypothetical protein D5S18_27610 [Nocardia panacis]|uniref:DUF3159 domain-containing protein n=1 Tax=Nocardia panacis TaxID=2340916 RepID=A0A3A4KDJ1_9NOCA|nr:VC0807 family protein [Nocardia panacis]RJO70945.1 hypothetical protein D5S18_27610 [Nocardia panacis]